ncbi:MAG: hypothetical protein WB493_10995 [Anaeromyxobacteraceae bacterium]
MARKHLWIPAAALVAAAGCSRDEVAHYRVTRQPGVADAGTPAGGAMGGMPGGPGAIPPPPDAASTGQLSWQLPRGWTESRSGGMRYASIKPTAAGKIDVSVTVFPGAAGGEIANVNRWRNQIGLPPVDEAALAKDRKSIKAPAGNVALFDYTSDGKEKTRLVAAILFAGGNSWFVKMVGDAGPVAASRADFVRLLESLRLASP